MCLGVGMLCGVLATCDSFLPEKKTDAPPVKNPSVYLDLTKSCAASSVVSTTLYSTHFKPILITGSSNNYSIIVWQNLKDDRTRYVMQKDDMSCILAVGEHTLYNIPKGLNKI